MARKSAIEKDPGSNPPAPDFRDISSHDAFSLHSASDSDPDEVQQIMPAAMKPALDLKKVPIWDETISTRDNAQVIKISLGSAGFLNSTKGLATRQKQMILLAALRHATAN